jgi:signal transduction histidine kinase
VSRRLRWLAVLVPTAIVVGVEVASDTVLDIAFPTPVSTIIVALTVFVCSSAVMFVAFRRVDALSDALRARNADLEVQNARAAALHQVSLAITALGDLDDILTAIVSHACDLLDADVALLVLVADDWSRGPRAWHGPDGSVTPDPAGAADPFAFVRPDLATSRLASPLRRGSETVGTLGVAAAAGRGFAVADVETLSSFAIQATIALENARLQESLREIAVVAERERIAREMHDGLAQVLGYVNTKSLAASELLAAGRVGDAQVQLDELAAAARSVYVDVRESILALRTPIPPGLGLVAAIRDLAVRFADASKVAVVVDAVDDGAADALGPESRAQVFRIVREALTNVRKHAAARRVRITVDGAADGLVVTVTDDGRGMGGPVIAAGGRSVPSVDWPRYGLDTMRERAVTIGGTVTWSAVSGGGTEVRIVVPAVSRTRASA